MMTTKILISNVANAHLVFDFNTRDTYLSIGGKHMYGLKIVSVKNVIWFIENEEKPIQDVLVKAVFRVDPETKEVASVEDHFYCYESSEIYNMNNMEYLNDIQQTYLSHKKNEFSRVIVEYGNTFRRTLTSYRTFNDSAFILERINERRRLITNFNIGFSSHLVKQVGFNNTELLYVSNSEYVYLTWNNLLTIVRKNEIIKVKVEDIKYVISELQEYYMVCMDDGVIYSRRILPDLFQLGYMENGIFDNSLSKDWVYFFNTNSDLTGQIEVKENWQVRTNESICDYVIKNNTLRLVISNGELASGYTARLGKVIRKVEINYQPIATQIDVYFAGEDEPTPYMCYINGSGVNWEEINIL